MQSTPSPRPRDDFDYSTPEAEEALRVVTALILEIREDVTGPLTERVELYERTLGLAVIPVLIRRAIRRLWGRRRARGLRAK